MAMVQTTSRVLYDGTRNCMMQFTGTCDGSGVETNEPKVIAANLNPSAATRLNVQRVEFSVNGGILRILWNSIDPQPFLDLEGQGFFDYQDFGGVTNPGAEGADDSANGDLLFTTLGFDAGSNYSVKIEMRKM